MNTSYLIIGSGRLARHLKFLLETHQARFTTWSRSEKISNLDSSLSSNPIVLLAISDSAIEDFYKENLHKFKNHVVHFSGFLHHPKMISAHPLMSFSYEIYPPEFYQKIHWTLCGIENLKTIFPFFENTYSVITPEQKPLYHAACVLGGNLSVLLWQEMSRIFSGLNISSKAEVVYLERILENYKSSPETALTGPFVRGDQKTISAHIHALEKSPYQNVYLSFLKAYQSLQKPEAL